MSKEKIQRYEPSRNGSMIKSDEGLYCLVREYLLLQSERDEYRQRLEENVKCIESLMHRNEELVSERDKLKKALENLFEIQNLNISISDKLLSVRNIIGESLTRKEAKDGE